MVALDVVTDTVAVWALVAVLGGWLVARQPHAALGGVVTLFGGTRGLDALDRQPGPGSR